MAEKADISKTLSMDKARKKRLELMAKISEEAREARSKANK